MITEAYVGLKLGVVSFSICLELLESDSITFKIGK